MITGASSGIGEALAREFAGPNIRLGLIGRAADRLEQIATACRAAGAVVETAIIDIRDRPRLHRWMADFDGAGAVDLLIANAGVSAGLGPDRTRESDDDAERLADINYKGTVNTVSGLVDGMQARRAGHIAIVASLAGLQALPDMPSYSASKSALVAYGHSLRGWLRPFNVSVSIVCPGFVTSPMSARHQGARPFEMPLDNAVGIIRRGLDRRRSMIAFPWPLVLGIWFNNLMPVAVQDIFMRMFHAEIDPDDRKD